MKADINTLSGPDLCAAVAEEVMEWKLRRGKPDPDGPDICGEDCWVSHASAIPVGVFRPDEDWGWWGMVFERATKPERDGGFGADARIGVFMCRFPDVASGPYVEHPLYRAGVRLPGQKRHRWSLSLGDMDIRPAFLRATLKAVRTRGRSRAWERHRI